MTPTDTSQNLDQGNTIEPRLALWRSTSPSSPLDQFGFPVFYLFDSLKTVFVQNLIHRPLLMICWQKAVEEELVALATNRTSDAVLCLKKLIQFQSNIWVSLIKIKFHDILGHHKKPTGGPGKLTKELC